MTKRKIIKIDEEKCNGCGECIPNCPEGALQIIDGKVRLISDLFCDGLGACIGHCPEGAISVEEREASKYDERKVMENIIKQGANVIKAHLAHLRGHKQDNLLEIAHEVLKEKNIAVAPDPSKSPASGSGCPGSKVADFKKKGPLQRGGSEVKLDSELGNWPVQLNLVPAFAPFLDNADLLIAADCVAFSYADFHRDLLKGKVLLVGCPKLDDIQRYQEKITQIFKHNNVKSVTYAHMEVPCCFGLINVIKDAIKLSGKEVPFTDVEITIKGERSK